MHTNKHTHTQIHTNTLACTHACTHTSCNKSMNPPHADIHACIHGRIHTYTDTQYIIIQFTSHSTEFLPFNFKYIWLDLNAVNCFQMINSVTVWKQLNHSIVSLPAPIVNIKAPTVSSRAVGDYGWIGGFILRRRTNLGERNMLIGLSLILQRGHLCFL